MFNSYQNDRTKAKEHSSSQELLKKCKQEIKSKNKYSKLKLKYDDRIRSFIENMLESPLKIEISAAKQNQNRRQSLLLKRIRNQSNKLKKPLIETKSYDTEYTPLQQEFRIRDKNKEIQSSMIFKPRNQLQRLKDQVFSTSTYLEPKGDEIYPELYKKTYFTAVKSLMVKANGTKQLFRNQSLSFDNPNTLSYHTVAKKVLQKCNYIPMK